MGEFRDRGRNQVDDKTEDLATAVIGAAIEVHRVLGGGLPESVYRNALCHELTLRGIEHGSEVEVPVFYKGVKVGSGRVDILVGGVLIVELKALEELADIHRAQANAYLKATHLQLALLINFGAVLLKDGIERIINTQ